ARAPASARAGGALHGLEQFVGLRLRLTLVARSESAGDAVFDVLVEDLERERLERRIHSRDLGEDVDAVAVVLDHPLDPADLSFDPVQALDERALVFRVPVGLLLADLGHVVSPWLVSRALVKRL